MFILYTGGKCLKSPRLGPGQKLRSGKSHYLTPKCSAFGESPPPAPRACFGRDRLIEKIVGLAETLRPLALIGAGGIGKTSIALTVLHHGRIKKRFGDNRRFIRCDQFPASRADFLRRLSQVIGAGVKNPGDLTPLRPFLTSKDMLIVLDNAESILDPQGASWRDVNGLVQELSRFSNVCLCITSRITIVPPDCRTFEIPKLSTAAARDAFYRIYEHGKESDSVNDILGELDFHPLSVTLLATVAHQSKWNSSRLVREWRQRHTGVLRVGCGESLAHTVELSLASLMFRELGPCARELLEVIAFFPQGVDEGNLDWLFPEISNRTIIFDTFCVLSLTYRNKRFITMLAPLRDYLRPKGPMSSPFLCITKDRYFTRMSIEFNRSKPAFRESRWIMSEDVNVEHLVDVFASVDGNEDEVWVACRNFIIHLYWHKPRRTVLGQKIEGLPDDHRWKSGCLTELAALSLLVGDHVEGKRLFNLTLKLRRGRGDDDSTAQTLGHLAETNRTLGLFEEGIKQAREALEIRKRLCSKLKQAECLFYLAKLFYEDGQLDAGKDAASQVIDLLPAKGEEYLTCQIQRLLGNIYRSKGRRTKAVHYLEAALAIASPFNWHDQLFWVHYSLALLFLDQRDFHGAQAHTERAKPHAVDGAYFLGRIDFLQASIWYEQDKLKEAKSHALRASETFEKLQAAGDLGASTDLLQHIERAMKI